VNVRAWILCGIAVVGLSARVAADTVRLTGTVSDKACGRDHHGHDPESCVRTCAEESGEYALVVGSRVYTLVADEDMRAELNRFAAREVVVTGERMNGDVVSVTSVKRADR
jgi:hypothetical protein